MPTLALLFAALSALLYVLLAIRPAQVLAQQAGQAAHWLWWPAWLAHGAAWLLSVAPLQAGASAWRLGFASVLSLTLWQVIGVYLWQRREWPLRGVNRALGLGGAVVALLGAWLPGEPVHAASSLAPLHWVLGIAAYGLFGAAVLHALLLDATEHRLRKGAVSGAPVVGVPLMTLERLTFQFVAVGFVVLSVALGVGFFSPHWAWGDRKTVLSLLSWGLFAALLIGRHWRGWRGLQATRWLYAGALALLLAYVGSRFVLELVLHRAPAPY